MINQPNNREYEFGELLSMVLAMFQQRIGIIIGGILFSDFVPMLALIPAGVVAGFTCAGINWNEPSAADFPRMIPMLITGFVCIIVTILASVALKIGWVSICLKITKNEPAPFSEFFSNFSYFMNFLATGFLMYLIIGAGMLLLVVPGVFLAIKLAFAPYLVIDQNMGPIEALKGSWEMSEGYSLKIFLAGVAYLVINAVVSFIPLVNIVGPLLVSGLFYLIITTLYRAKKGDLVAPN